MSPLSDGDGDSGCALEAHRRLQLLYEVSKLLTRIPDAEATVRAIVEVMARALPLSSAVVVLASSELPRTIAWAPAGGQSVRAEAYALASYAYWVAGSPAMPGGALPHAEAPVGHTAEHLGHFIVLPLVIALRPIFGVLLVDSTVLPSEQDLLFVNAVVNQLAIALAWRTTTEARQAAAEADTSAAQGDLAAAQGDLATAQGDLATAQGDLATAQGDLAAAHGDLATAQGATATARSNQETAEWLQGRFQALAIENARLFRAAEQASRARENLLAVVSHDLRNQLSAILMSVGLLLRRKPTVEQDRRAGRNMVTIQRSAQRMSRLIGDLLDMASVEAGHLALVWADQEADTLVRLAIQPLEEQAAARSLHLISELVGPAFTLHCDPERIAQVFSNLVGNAIKFTAPGGEVVVQVEAQGPNAYFSVADNGVGIASDEIPHVFDRFWQGNRTTRAGTGLGMAIAKGIVEAHGGTIWLESQLDVGTTVRFTLPLAPKDPTARPVIA